MPDVGCVGHTSIPLCILLIPGTGNATCVLELMHVSLMGTVNRIHVILGTINSIVDVHVMVGTVNRMVHVMVGTINRMVHVMVGTINVTCNGGNYSIVL